MDFFRPNVVLIDDEKDLLDGLKFSLEPHFQVSTFCDPQVAMTHMMKQHCDAIVLDFHIPGYDTFEVYSEFRKKNIKQPVLFLTGECDIGIKLSSMNLGVDDFLQKPIRTEELTAYLHNRIRSYRSKNPTRIKISNLDMNLKDPEVKVDGQSIFFTPKEYQILSLLISNPNMVIPKSEFIEKIWCQINVEENNLDTHMSNLRKKLKNFQGKIKTIKCVGYVLRV